MSSSNGILVPFLPLLFMVRFHTTRSLSLKQQCIHQERLLHCAMGSICPAIHHNVLVLLHNSCPIPFFNGIKKDEEEKAICHKCTCVVVYILTWFAFFWKGCACRCRCGDHSGAINLSRWFTLKFMVSSCFTIVFE